MDENVIKLPVGSFKWVENKSQFSKDLIGTYNEDSDEIYFREVDVQYLEKLRNLQNDRVFLNPMNEK